MAKKAPDAFRTISEVADWLDIPAHVLRFWESKFQQIKPVKRAGGRRYYRPADMELIGGIKRLLHDDGMTIRGVQKLISDNGIKHVSAMSQALDMPSDAEAAERRAARRAKRKARTSKSKPEPMLETTPQSVEDQNFEPASEAHDERPSEPEKPVEVQPEQEEVAEAPFIDVPADDETGGDNILTMPARETQTEPVAATAEASAETTEPAEPKATKLAVELEAPDTSSIGLTGAQKSRLAMKKALRDSTTTKGDVQQIYDRLKALRDRVANDIQSD